jgi:hypothetical protein
MGDSLSTMAGALLAGVSCGVFAGVSTVGREYSPYNHTYYSMPKLSQIWHVFNTPQWRAALGKGFRVRFVAGALPRVGRFWCVAPALRLAVLVLDAVMLSAAVRLTGVIVADTTGTITTLGQALRFISRTQGGAIACVRGAPFAFLALLVEHEFAPWIRGVVSRRCGRIAGVAVALSTAGATSMLWFQTEAFGLQDPRKKSTKTLAQLTYRLSHGSFSSELVWAATSMCAALL